MRDATLSRFTPSLLSGAGLEAMFVQRQDLAAQIIERVVASATSGTKHYVLVTGPRGIGKTHLISLIHHRAVSRPDVRQRLRIAWLREEEWGVASYLDFLLVVLRAMADADELGVHTDAYVQLRAVRDAEEAERRAETLLVQAADDATILILAENLDEIFRGLGNEGQHKLRALIQNNPVFAIVATAQSLFTGVMKRDEPFFGFFQVHRLKPLTLDNAVALVENIAREEGNDALAAALNTPRGRARMRVVHHLAAGNPRVYVIFSQFLTVASLDALVQPLLQTLDDLTPYYQARMAHLTPQQRKLVEYLCDHSSPITVGDLANATFVSPQTTSSQLGKLAQLGYVRSHKHGRTSYYELREPLLRLTLQVKKMRGEPVQIVVEFLRLWYSATELHDRMASDTSATAKAYVEKALALQQAEGNAMMQQLCWQAFQDAVDEGEEAGAMLVAEEIFAIDPTPEDLRRFVVDERAPLQVRIAASMKESNLLVAQRAFKRASEARKAAIDQFSTLEDLAAAATASLLGATEARHHWTHNQFTDAAAAAESATASAARLPSDDPYSQTIDLWARVTAYAVRRPYYDDPEACETLERMAKTSEALSDVGPAGAAKDLRLWLMIAASTNRCWRLTLELAHQMIDDAPSENEVYFVATRGLVAATAARDEASIKRFSALLNETGVPSIANAKKALEDYAFDAQKRDCWHEAHDAYTQSYVYETDAQDLALSKARSRLNHALGCYKHAQYAEAKALLGEVHALLPSLEQRDDARAAARHGLLLGSCQAATGHLDAALATYTHVAERTNADTAELQGMALDAVWSANTIAIAIGQKPNIHAAVDAIQAAPPDDTGLVIADGPKLLLRLPQSTWRTVVDAWMHAFDTPGLVSSLGVGVARTARTLVRTQADAATARAWLDLWASYAADTQELRIGSGILTAVVSAHYDHDREPMQMLTAEMRQIAEDILAIATPPGSPGRA